MRLVVEGKDKEEIAQALADIARQLLEGYVQGINFPLNWELGEQHTPSKWEKEE